MLIFIPNHCNNSFSQHVCSQHILRFHSMFCYPFSCITRFTFSFCNHDNRDQMGTVLHFVNLAFIERNLMVCQSLHSRTYASSEMCDCAKISAIAQLYRDRPRLSGLTLICLGPLKACFQFICNCMMVIHMGFYNENRERSGIIKLRSAK
jgi:hypothetical protein